MRKGMMYTIVSVMLLAIIGTLIFMGSRVGVSDIQKAEATRIRSVNAFIHNLEADSARASYIAGFRSLIAMEQQVASTGQYILDPDDIFKEVFISGNISNMKFQIMENSSFGEYLDRVKVEARRQGIQFNVTVKNITLTQVDPWNLLVLYTLDINISDLRGTAQWRTERTFSGRIPVEDIRDPVFTVNTFGRIQQVIRRTPIKNFVDDVGDANDTTNLMVHFNESYYSAAGRGPNILMRFEGNLSDDQYGIESFVDTEELDNQGLVVFSSNTVVDYKYFNSVGADACNIQNMPSYFKLDTASMNLYEVEGKLEYDAC